MGIILVRAASLKFAVLFFVYAVTLVTSKVSYAQAVHYVLPKVQAIYLDANPRSGSRLYTIGLIYGYGLGDWTALEMDANYGGYGAEYEVNGRNGKFRGWNFGLSAVMRYPFNETSYIKGKFGGAYKYLWEIGASSGNTIDNSIAPALGAGFGHIFSNDVTLEFEYSRDFGQAHNFSVALHYPF